MKKTAAVLAGWTSVLLLAGCAETENMPESPDADMISGTAIEQNSEFNSESYSENLTNPDAPDESRVIYWLADYDICPREGQERSAALAMFEDQYGGSICWIPCDAGYRQEALDSCLLSGDPVDMVAFAYTDFPSGILKNQFAPLDAYLDLEDAMWDEMRTAIEDFAWQGQHYIIPYAVSDPLLLLYSRQTCKENALEDPYILYQNGTWDWDAFLEMMQQFTAGGAGRYGATGQLGKGLLQSVGIPVTTMDATGSLTSNLDQPGIATAETFLEQIRDDGLYHAGWYDHIPDNILFYAMQDWALDKSNAANPDGDYMAVPFPKAPDAAGYYLSAEYQAKLLVKQSEKGEAVAAYLRCERLAATDADCLAQANQNALQQVISPAGEVLSYRTQEQHTAIQSYLQGIPCFVDCSYGLGRTAYTQDAYDNDTRGALNLLQEAILLDSDMTWEQLYPVCRAKIKEAFLLHDMYS